MFGILSGLAIYCYILSRRVLSLGRPNRSAIGMVLLVVCGLGIAVDIGVFVRVGWF